MKTLTLLACGGWKIVEYVPCENREYYGPACLFPVPPAEIEQQITFAKNCGYAIVDERKAAA